MGNVVGSQESRYQVSDGARLPAVRPEQERAQAPFPADVRLVVRKNPWSTCPGPHRPALLAQGPLQGRQSPMAGSTPLRQGTLETTSPQVLRPRPRAPQNQETSSLGREGLVLHPLLPFPRAW